MIRTLTSLALAVLVSANAAAAQRPNTVFLDEHTWTEVRAAIDEGTTTVIVPTAGTEQNGPHMVLGKHKFIINHTSDLIAARTGQRAGGAGHRLCSRRLHRRARRPHRPHALRRGDHLSERALHDASRVRGAEPRAVHGFTDIVFIGDSGGNQNGMRSVSEMLNEEWAGEGKEGRVHFVGDYYSNNGFREWLMEEHGYDADTIGGHAGISDTSQLLHVAPQHIRRDQLAPLGGGEGSGVSGDPTKASAEYGRMGVQFKVQAALRQIRELTQGR